MSLKPWLVLEVGGCSPKESKTSMRNAVKQQYGAGLTYKLMTSIAKQKVKSGVYLGNKRTIAVAHLDTVTAHSPQLII